MIQRDKLLQLPQIFSLQVTLGALFAVQTCLFPSLLMIFSNRKLYCGYNGANNVFTFLPSDGGHIRKFKADLNVFLKVCSC